MQTAKTLIRRTDGRTDKHDVYRTWFQQVEQCVEGKSEGKKKKK